MSPLTSAVIDFAVLVALSAVAFGCARAPGDGGHTAEYYDAHAAERGETLRVCREDPARLYQTPDCINARASAREEGVGSLRRLPPMGLSRSASASDASGSQAQAKDTH